MLKEHACSHPFILINRVLVAVCGGMLILSLAASVCGSFITVRGSLDQIINQEEHRIMKEDETKCSHKYEVS